MTEVIMTNSFRGGTGKSTIISNVASTLASYGNKVIIIDGDVISPGVHALFGLSIEDFDKTLTEYLVGKVPVHDILYDISENLALPDESLFLVPANMAQSDIANFLHTGGRSNKFHKVIDELREEYEPDYILIDTHPGVNEELLNAAPASDVLFNVIRPDNQDYQGLGVSGNMAKELGLDVYVVLNKVHPKMDSNQIGKDLFNKYKIPVAGALPLSDDILLSQSQYVFTDMHPDHPYSKEINGILNKVFGIKPKEHLESMYTVLNAIRLKKAVAEKDYDKLLKGKMNFKSGREYIGSIIDSGYVDVKSGSLVINDKGLKFLKKYKTMKKFVKDFGL